MAFGLPSQGCQEVPISVLGQALLLLHPSKPSPLEIHHHRFAPISISWLITPGQESQSCGCWGSPRRVALPSWTVSLPHQGQHSGAASLATCSTLASSHHGCFLGLISHSRPFFQVQVNLAPMISLQDGLTIEHCREQPMPPSPVQAFCFLPCHQPHAPPVQPQRQGCCGSAWLAQVAQGWGAVSQHCHHSGAPQGGVRAS